MFQSINKVPSLSYDFSYRSGGLLGGVRNAAAAGAASPAASCVGGRVRGRLGNCVFALERVKPGCAGRPKCRYVSLPKF